MWFFLTCKSYCCGEGEEGEGGEKVHLKTHGSNSKDHGVKIYKHVYFANGHHPQWYN